MGTIAFVAFMAFLIINNKERWWLYFVLIFGLLAKFGFQLRMGGLIVAIIVAKLLKDIFQAR